MSSQQIVPRVDPEEEELRKERREGRRLRRKQQRRARIILWSTISLSVLLLLVIGFFYLQIQNILAINAINAAYPPINGITCDSTQHTNYHIHAHVTIYIDGKIVPIPQGIGIASDNSCFYWLHTHTPDGIIHIEAAQPSSNLALDDFLTVWHAGFAKLGFPQQLLQTSGWKIFVNGKAFSGTVTSPLNTEVPMHSHDAITLEYGAPMPPPDKFYAFPADLPT